MNVLSALFGTRQSAATIDLASPAVARDPFPHYEELRRKGPVQYLARHQAWIVLGHDEVQTAFMRPDLFSNRPYAEVDAVLLAADPPEHTAVRRVVMRYFSTEAVDRLVAFAGAHAPSLLRPRLDVVPDYAMALTSAVAARLIGFDDDALARIRAARGRTPYIPDWDAFVSALHSLAERAAIYGSLRGDGLDDAQVRSLVRLLWLAATTTTERVIAHCVLRLLRHEEARDPALVEPFVEEVLRLHPPELLVPRLTTQPAALGGAAIPENALVYLCLAAANRDPAKFERPSELRLDRPPARIFTFGSGVHHCVGATLGRRVVQTAVRTLLVRGSRFRAAEALDDVVQWASLTSSPVARLLIEGAD